MVLRNGPAAARSSSTWIHWWSWVTSAKPSTCAWVTIVHGVGPSTTPSESGRSAYAKVREGATTSAMGGPLWCGCRYGALPQPAPGDGPPVGLRRAVVDPEGPHLAVVARE